jgi:hypothetical protein
MEAKWKRCEREVAKLLGGQRQPITGRPGADVLTFRWACEVKTRARLPLWLERAFNQAEAAAKETGRTPLLVLVHTPGQGRKARRLAVLPLETLIGLCAAGGDENAGTEAH